VSDTTTGTTPASTTTSTARALRIVAAVEAVSWLLLIVATIVKYSTDPHKALGVQIMGPIHGVLFLAYVGLALEVRRRLGWDGRTTLIVLADSIIPAGGFVVARRADLR
jgi:integral membrane protein